MKVENLEKAVALRDELDYIDQRINATEESITVSMTGSSYVDSYSKNLKYESESILKTVKPLFLSALKKEREDILDKIDDLD